MYKTDVINNQLATRILAANNIFLDYKDMPVFKAGDPTKPGFEEIGKFIQRVKSVGGLTEGALTHLYNFVDLPTDGIEDLTFDDGDTSRSGESEGSSGTGNSQSSQGGDMNLENKNLVQDGDYMIDADTGKLVGFNKED